MPNRKKLDTDQSTSGFALLRVLDKIVSHQSTVDSGRKRRRQPKPTLCHYGKACVAYWESKLPESADPSRLGKAVAFARAYLEVIYDHFPEFASLDWDGQLSVVELALTWDNFEKVAKWQCCAPMAYHLRNPLPPKPTPNVSVLPFTGASKRFLKIRLCNRTSQQSLHFVNSILLGVKRGCLPPDQAMVSKQLESHAKGLSKQPSDYKADLKPFVKRVLRGIKPLRNVRSIRDTGGAAYDTSRSLGGKWEAVVRLYNGVSFSEILLNDQLLFVDSRGKSYHGRLTPNWFEIRSLICTENTDKVRSIGLLEPLKVRVITTGQPEYSVYLEPIRKRLHDWLRQMACFKPLDNPKISKSDLAGIVERETKLGLNFPSWVSGDYAAATDNLNMHCTRQCISAIASALGRQSDIGLIERSLCGAQLEYPTEPQIASVPQLNGQLMGNPMSFPILCLVNLFAYKSALDEYTASDNPIESLPVLVNGDDIVFRADSRLLAIWTKQISAVGFELSVGKYYVHKKVLTLNSQLFVHSGSDFTEITYTNPGLLYKFGFAANKRKTQLLPLDQIFNQFLSGCWSPPRAQKQLRYYWKSLYNKQSNFGLYNLYTPRSSGGLGVNPIGTKNYQTQFQKWLAFVLHQLQNWDPTRAQKLTQSAIFTGVGDRAVIRHRRGLRAVWLSSDPKPCEIEAFEHKLRKFSLTWKSNNTVSELNSLRETIDWVAQASNFNVCLLSELHKRVVALKADRTFDNYDRSNSVIEWCAKSGEVRFDRDFDPDFAWYRQLNYSDLRWLRAWAGFGPADLLPVEIDPQPANRRRYHFTGVFTPLN